MSRTQVQLVRRRRTTILRIFENNKGRVEVIITEIKKDEFV